jgi:hypothetical protein
MIIVPRNLAPLAVPVSTWQEYRRADDNMFAFTLQVRPWSSAAPLQLSKGTETEVPSELKMRTLVTPAVLELTLVTVHDASF